MRLDQEAAVKAYRAALAEVERGYLSGGATEATAQLKLVATARYLKLAVSFWELLREKNQRATGRTTIIYAGALDWSPGEIHVKACEDVSKVKLVDSRGRDRTPKGLRRYVQEYTIAKVDGRWKVSDVETRQVSSFDEYGCKP